MQRRKFLRNLFGGIAVAAVAPTALFTEPVRELTYRTYVMGADAIIGEYSNYANFSSFALASAIDQHVADAAHELSANAGLAVSELYKFSA